MQPTPSLPQQAESYSSPEPQQTEPTRTTTDETPANRSDAPPGIMSQRLRHKFGVGPAPIEHKPTPPPPLPSPPPPNPNAVYERVLNMIPQQYERRTVTPARVTADQGLDLFNRLLQQRLTPMSGSLWFTAKQQKVVHNLVRYFLNDATGPYPLNKGLYLYSKNTGSGKTQMLEVFADLMYLLDMADHKFGCVPAEVITTKVALAKSLQPTSEYMANQWMIDDLGAEPRIVYVYQDPHDVMSNVLNHRYRLFVNKGVRTHFTSNYEPKELKNMYGSRLYSRMKHWVTSIKLDGPDKREYDKAAPTEKELETIYAEAKEPVKLVA